MSHRAASILHGACLLAVAGALSIPLAGCGGGGSESGASKDPHARRDGDKHHDHADDHGDHDHGKKEGHSGHAMGEHGPMVDLGSVVIGAYTVKVSRDEGELSPGGEAAVDLWIDGDLAGISAVRIWVGDRDATASIKARAEPEGNSDPGHRHTHAEIPDPLAPDSALWIEIEAKGGEKKSGSVPLMK